MANCSYCDSFILFGGQTDTSGRYCNADCQQAGNLLALSQQIPREQIDQIIRDVHQGSCPRCQGRGPVDVHKAHQVWSAVVLTSWASKPAMSCKSCAVKRQIGATLLSGIVGWWGLPWGLVMTPVQILRNVVGMFGGPAPSVPSPLLERIVRIQVAADAWTAAHEAQQSPPPLPT
mgnify:CR=1 FL=1